MALTADYLNERGDVYLRLYDDLTDDEIFELRNEAFNEAIEDGFLKPPRVPRPKDDDWLDPAIAYATEQGLDTHPAFKRYAVSVTYDTVTPDDVEAGEPSERGFEIEDETMDLNDLAACVRKYGFSSCSESPLTNGTAWFSSQNEADFRTGETTDYSLHIRDAKGQPLDVDALAKVAKAVGLAFTRLATTLKPGGPR